MIVQDNFGSIIQDKKVCDIHMVRPRIHDTLKYIYTLYANYIRQF